MGRDVLSYNHQMHVKLIGGEDSDDPACPYKAYEAASSVLGMFDDRLTGRALPPWFWIGHLAAGGCFLSGMFLLFRIFWP